jgi:type VI secretion system protein ImpF
MAREVLQPVGSLLDRLTDDAPGSTRESTAGEWEERREARAAVIRDLGFLLNCRRVESDVPEEFDQTRASVLTYGLEEFSGLSLDASDSGDTIRRSIQHAIWQFEPRLTNVIVDTDETASGVRGLHFRIRAILRNGSESEPLDLDATLRADDRRFQLSG